MAELEVDTFPLVTKGHKFEDFAVGQVYVHHWGRTITAGDNSLFSTATCNWNPMHLNAEYARAHGHPDVVVNPMLVLGTIVGLSVEDLCEAGGPFLGLDSCEFAPARPSRRHHRRDLGSGGHPPFRIQAALRHRHLAYPGPQPAR